MPARTSSPCTICTAAATACWRTCASARPGLGVSFVDLSDAAALEAAIRPDTRLLWVETPTNPLLKLVDLTAVAKLARSRGILTVCDNTFATPYIQRPLEHGFDVVMHSTTKYLNGHSDAIGGAAIVRGGQRSRRAHRLPAERGRRRAGPVRLVPDAARHQDPGAAHGAPLRQRARHRAASSSSTRRSSACTTPGSRAIRSTRSRSGRWPAATAASSPRCCAAASTAARRALERCHLFSLAESLGGVESLIEHPGDHDARLAAGGDARFARHRRRTDPAVGRRGGYRGPARAELQHALA